MKLQELFDILATMEKDTSDLKDCELHFCLKTSEGQGIQMSLEDIEVALLEGKRALIFCFPSVSKLVSSAYKVSADSVFDNINDVLKSNLGIGDISKLNKEQE